MASSDIRPLNWVLPIPERRRAVYEYYQLTFTPDGCPMKRMPQGDVFHPILPAYLAVDYVLWAKESNDTSYLNLARKVMDHALRFGEYRNGALVFIYRPETKLSNIPCAFYSALTQAKYIRALSEMSQCMGNIYHDQLRAIFNSLLIPINDNGVLVCRNFGWIVEEYPHDPPLYTLNGWLTVLVILYTYKNFLSQIGIDVDQFLAENLRAVERLLPLYDAEFCCNSRYQLTGFIRIKALFDQDVIKSVEGFSIEIPGDGLFEGALESADSRWHNYLERKEKRLLMFNVVLSLASFPLENIFHLRLIMNKPSRLSLYLADGDYRPDITGMPTARWRLIGIRDINAGDQCLSVPISWDENNLFAYPTNFKKRIGSKLYNAYHYIHVSNLAYLYFFSGNNFLRHYALQWLDYCRQWASLPFLQCTEYSLKQYQYDDFEHIQKLLSKRDRHALMD